MIYSTITKHCVNLFTISIIGYFLNILVVYGVSGGNAYYQEKISELNSFAKLYQVWAQNVISNKTSVRSIRQFMYYIFSIYIDDCNQLKHMFIK